MAAPLFDIRLRQLRRDRAARLGPALFLLERAFADCLERVGDVSRRFCSALLVGCPDPSWIARLRLLGPEVTAVEPGHLFAEAAGAGRVDEEQLDFAAGRFDLCLAVGTLDTAADLPLALLAIRRGLADDALLLGALTGGDSLPALRSAMLAADQAVGRGASAHVHPRIEPSALAALLTRCGFVMPVVDVDRVAVAYRGLDDLVRDLRGMAATNLLAERDRRPLSRAALAAACDRFVSLGDGHRTVEQFDLLHFAAWTPAAAGEPPSD